MVDFNAAVIEEFRANHGKVGGNFEGAPLLLLHSVGAKSGETRVSPMMYLPDGDRFLVFASKAGAPEQPGLVPQPQGQPRRHDRGRRRDPRRTRRGGPGAERDEKYAEQAALYPGFADYEAKTDRVIPVRRAQPPLTSVVRPARCGAPDLGLLSENA